MSYGCSLEDTLRTIVEHIETNVPGSRVYVEIDPVTIPATTSSNGATAVVTIRIGEHMASMVIREVELMSKANPVDFVLRQAKAFGDRLREARR